MFGKSMKEAAAVEPSTELADVEPTSSHDVERGNSNPKKDVSADQNEDDYPHGWKLIILASASIIAVFLIALDQVREQPSVQNTFEHR